MQDDEAVEGFVVVDNKLSNMIPARSVDSTTVEKLAELINTVLRIPLVLAQRRPERSGFSSGLVAAITKSYGRQLRPVVEGWSRNETLLDEVIGLSRVFQWAVLHRRWHLEDQQVEVHRRLAPS